ncbi:Uncharacterized protein YuxK [Linum grandiflorum]
MMARMLLRRLRSLQQKPPLKKLSHFSSSSATSLPKDPAASISKAAAAAGVADVVEDEEDLLESVAYVSPVTLPSILQPRVVVYDGVCHLCHGGVKWIIQVDKHKKIKFCRLQSQAAEPYLKLCGLERDDVLRRFLFVEGPGQYHQASTAT